MPGVGGGHRGGGGGGFGGGRGGSFGGGGGFGGGRPSGGFGGGPRPGGFGGPHHHHPHHHYPHGHFWGPGWGWGPRWGRGPHFGGGLVTAIIFIVIFSIVVPLSVLSECTYVVMEDEHHAEARPEYESITPSTWQREPLDPKYVNPIEEYYYDDMGLINTAAAQFSLQNSLKDFYLKTGVQPYLYIADDLDGNTNPNLNEVETFLLAKYGELFTDEGHLLVLYFEYAGGEYNTWYVWGNDAHRYVMDDEACEIVLDYLDYYYNAPETADYTDMFCSAFDAASARIMGGKTNKDSFPWFTIGLVGVIAVIIIVAIVKNYNNNGKGGNNDNMSEEDKRKEKYRRKYGG